MNSKVRETKNQSLLRLPLINDSEGKSRTAVQDTGNLDVKMHNMKANNKQRDQNRNKEPAVQPDACNISSIIISS
jgi:hypothetical protein